MLNGVRNSILGNSIFRNGELGIDLGPDGVTGNDDGDGDGGANLLQNFPLITSAVGNTVSGTLNSAAGRTFRIEIFSNSGVAPCDSSGNGEGETFVGTTNVTTDTSGNQSFTVTLATPLPSGAAVTATATDPDGNTSEFSQCATAQGVNKIVDSEADSARGQHAELLLYSELRSRASRSKTVSRTRAGCSLPAPIP